MNHLEILKKGVETWNQWWEKNSTTRADLNWADLSGANLSGANLFWAHLSGAHLSGANLSGANLNWADLSEANLSGAHLSGANLSWAHLNWAHLSRADLSGANLSGAHLSRAHLSGANLSGADLSGANLSGANLNWAHLSGAHLSGANLSGANLSGATSLCSPSQWMAEHFSRDNYGNYVVYKAQSPSYSSPENWIWEPGSELTEVCHSDRALDCACGVNFATRGWIEQNYNNYELWLARIEIEDWPGIVVPYNTNGKARCERLTLIEKVKEVNN